MPTNCHRNMDLHTNGEQCACQKFIRADKQHGHIFYEQILYEWQSPIHLMLSQRCVSFREYFGTWSDSIQSLTGWLLPNRCNATQVIIISRDGQILAGNARSLREILSFIYMMINALALAEIYKNIASWSFSYTVLVSNARTIIFRRPRLHDDGDRV